MLTEKIFITFNFNLSKFAYNYTYMKSSKTYIVKLAYHF